MFFADPVKAFINLRSALADDGRMVFLCWQAANKKISLKQCQSSSPHKNPINKPIDLCRSRSLHD